MALICNSFADNTIGQTQQVAACKAPHLANLSDHELLPEQFMFLVLDSLNRLSDLAAVPYPIASATPCDAALALQNASCALLTNTPSFPVEPAQLQALILWMLNEGICNA